MHILINTATTHKGGGVQVAKSFIEECKAYPNYRFTVILGLGLSKLIDPSAFSGNFNFYTIAYRPATKVFSWKDQAAFFKKIEQKERPDVVFTTSGPAYWKPEAPHVMGYNLPHYIYKDSPFFTLLSFQQKLKWKFKGVVIRYFTRRDAQTYIVQTDDVKKRLQKWIGANNVITITNTYGSQYNFSRFGKQILPEKQNDEYRLLLLSGYYLHKNIELLNKIIPILNKLKETKIKFVLSLPREDFEKTINEEFRNNIINVGVLDPEKCPQLYEECDAVFLPTLLECFSATYAEAMKMKLPIVTTNLGFAKTICGNAALYFQPLDANDAAHKIIKLKNNRNLKEELLVNAIKEIMKFNSASERAKMYLEVCRESLK